MYLYKLTSNSFSTFAFSVSMSESVNAELQIVSAMISTAAHSTATLSPYERHQNTINLLSSESVCQTNYEQGCYVTTKHYAFS